VFPGCLAFVSLSPSQRLALLGAAARVQKPGAARRDKTGARTPRDGPSVFSSTLRPVFLSSVLFQPCCLVSLWFACFQHQLQLLDSPTLSSPAMHVKDNHSSEIRHLRLAERQKQKAGERTRWEAECSTQLHRGNILARSIALALRTVSTREPRVTASVPQNFEICCAVCNKFELERGESVKSCGVSICSTFSST
jgi:hypothetical protein